MSLPVRTLVCCALLALVASPARLHAQFSSCKTEGAIEETDLTKIGLYKMFNELFLRPDGGRAPENSTYLIGSQLQRTNVSGRYQPAFGKCDPQTDESIMFIQQIIPTGVPNASGSATGGGGGSAGSASRFAFGSSRANDEVIVGFVDRGDFTPFHAFRWTLAGGVVDLGTLDPANNATRTSIATATNADATVVVGYSQVNATTQHAFRWTNAGMVDLGAPAGATRDSRAIAVSAAGDVIVGDGSFADPNAFTGFRSGAFRWTSAGGFRDLGALAPGFFSVATRVSGDGNTIVGQAGVEIKNGNNSTNGSKAFRWTSTGGIQPIGPLPGHTHAVATGVSDNGKVVVGVSSAGPLSYEPVFPRDRGTAFIWTESAGIKELRQALVDDGFKLTGITLVTATSISADGQYITGAAVGPLTPPNEVRPYLIKRCDAANGVTCTPFKAAPAAPTYTLTVTSPATSVKAGENLTSTLTVTPSGGFTQAVTFSCAGLPATTACAFAPASLTPNGAAISTTLTITTTAPTRGGSGTIIQWSGPVTTAMLASVVLLWIFGLSTRPRRRLAAAAAMAALLTSCGGGGDDGGTTEPPPLTGGTAAGTYPITITATSGSGAAAISRTVGITMTVTR